jgi:hypothetical protein
MGKDAGGVKTPVLKQGAPVDAESLYASAWNLPLVHEPPPEPLCTRSRCEFRNDIFTVSSGASQALAQNQLIRHSTVDLLSNREYLTLFSALEPSTRRRKRTGECPRMAEERN